MANLTITIRDNVLKRARIRALEQNTSVNAIVQGYLEAYAGAASEREAAVMDLLRLSREAASRRGKRRWARDELHER